ncbi:MAG: F0F1 ATP synthase subunit epsilon [Candidatus Latescibacterota bacterium]|nr:MAG: F0F1 ATP synthase subunit epsilon [Candidatus Latescibacterota bacterium]
MEAPTYRFTILSPKARILDDDVVSIVAPGEAGYLGVLANHAPLVSTMKEGDLKVTWPDGKEKMFRIGGGILRVAHNTAVLLTESIEEAGT